jgi:plasmid stabilization system protein ParE
VTVSRIEFAPEVAADFDRILDHLVAHEVEDAAARIQDIVSSVDVLARSPLIGRPVEHGKRELVIGRGSRGYVALYRFVVELDSVFVLAVRSQKEAGYAGS